MTIRNEEYYKSQLWDWGFLDGCFSPTKIKVTDIDGFVERNGKFLVIETKSPGAEIPYGQRIMFNQMIKSGLFTIYIVWGYANNPERIRIITRKTDIERDCDELLLQRYVIRWFEYANS